MFAPSFQAEESRFKTRKTSVATLVTVAVHALLLLFLIYTILTPPDPPYEENGGGMTVNFGTDESGMGDLQPLTLTPLEQATQNAAASSASADASSKEELETQNMQDAPEIETPKAPSPKPKPVTNNTPKPIKNTNTNTVNNTAKTEAPPTPTADPNALFNKGAYGKPNKSKGDGTGTTPGDQGKPTGDPNSHNYLGEGDGTGSGKGTGDLNGGYSLHGRSKLSLPAPPQCPNKGKVVVSIKVDRSGKVVDAVFRRFESTVFDQCNVSNALAAARKATFNADGKAPEVQEGTITYVYKVH